MGLEHDKKPKRKSASAGEQGNIRLERVNALQARQVTRGASMSEQCGIGHDDGFKQAETRIFACGARGRPI